MSELQTSEHLIFFMKKEMRLSRYDSKFLSNVERLIQDTNKVTSNQVSLLQKIIRTYTAQFAKREMFVEELVQLPWNAVIVQSESKYTDAFITISNNKIQFKSPYNNRFIKALKTEIGHTFKWDNERRIYESTFGPNSLKFITEISVKHYDIVHKCLSTDQLLAQLNNYSNVKYWNPTLVNTNGNLIIAATNNWLDTAIAGIELNREVTTLATLAKFGITIDESVFGNDLKTKFAGQFYTKIELSAVTKIVPWLTELGCDFVYFSGARFSPEAIQLRKHLLIANINWANIGDIDTIPPVSRYKFPIVIRFRFSADTTYEPIKVAKIITLVNSQPIDIK
jgi:hypothetical protein